MYETINIQARMIDSLQQKIEELLKENAALDKKAKGIYGEYQLLQYEIRGLPTPGELAKLRLDLLHAQQKIKALEDFSVVQDG